LGYSTPQDTHFDSTGCNVQRTFCGIDRKKETNEEEDEVNDARRARRGKQHGIWQRWRQESQDLLGWMGVVTNTVAAVCCWSSA